MNCISSRPITLFARIGFSIIIITFILTINSCSKSDTGKEETELSSSDKATPGLDISGLPFIEIIYEISDSPFQDSDVYPADKPARLNGYILDESAAHSKKILYPAMGKEWAEPNPVSFLLGYRIIDRVIRRSPMYQSLKAYKLNQIELKTENESPISERLLSCGMYSTLLPPVTINVEMTDSAIFSFTAQGHRYQIRAGVSHVLFQEEKSYTISDLAKTISDAVEKSEDELTQEDKKLLRNSVRYRFSEEKPAKFYCRLTAIGHGNAEVAKFDARRQWNIAEKKLTEGPYQEALIALENVLLAAPTHAEALRRWALTKKLIEQGSEPAVLNGKLIFSSGKPTKKHKAIWRKYHEGIATLSRPQDPKDEVVISLYINDSTFKLSIPSGTYRLMVLVPGFKESEQTILIQGRREINVALESK